MGQRQIPDQSGQDRTAETPKLKTDYGAAEWQRQPWPLTVQEFKEL